MKSYSAKMEAVVDPFTTCEREWHSAGYGWLSPRISFSQDFAAINSLSPEKPRKDDEIVDAECSSEFEFCMAKASSLDLLPPGAGALMLAADELFSEGKVVPLHLLQPLRREGSRQKEEEQQRWLGLPRPNFEHPSMSLDIGCADLRRSCVSLENSRCSSPSRSILIPLTTPSSPKGSRHSSRIKDFFFRNSKLHTPEPSQEPAASSSHRRPISARSFWPFSRSNSAIVSKTTTPPALSRRSNSAAERTTGMSLLSLKNTTDRKNRRRKSENAMPCLLAQSPRIVGKITQISCFPSSGHIEKNLTADGPKVEAILSTVSISAIPLVPSLKEDCPSLRIDIGNCKTEDAIDNEHSEQASNSDTELRDATKELLDSMSGLNAAVNLKGAKSVGKVERTQVSGPLQDLGRAGPGRKTAGSNAAVGRTASKILESCNAKSNDRTRSQGGRSLERQKSYSASVRVTPVLHLPSCMGPSMRAGKASKDKLLNLLWRKEKQSDSPCKASPVINLRK